ncbi:MAG TPA: ABC transporter permease [Candidatus Sumerlaeota bacterium]|nr:ABC transporter permease [Candidatus Sumerlaeota bacterium]
MKQRLRNIWLLAWTLMLEAWRRREIYIIVAVTVALIAGLRMVHFFDLEGLGKFYREICLKTMNLTTGLTVIFLAARQLPREFTNRTIYPLLAKPVSRMEFLLGKYCGVLAASVFCYALFLGVFLAGSLSLHAPVQMGLFLQSIYLQIVAFAVLAALVFLLSMLMTPEGAVTLALILFVASQVLMNLMDTLYDFMSEPGRVALLVLHFVIPQLTLFDLSSKVINSVDVQKGVTRVVWEPLAAGTMGTLTLYGAVYIVLFLGGAYLLFRRKPL